MLYLITKDLTLMSNEYGKLFTESIKDFSHKEIAALIKKYGVIAFKGEYLNNFDHFSVMAGIGKIQNLKQQHVPTEYRDVLFRSMVNMSNDDFLKERRLGWHIDHTYNGPNLLPIRSLSNFGDCDPGNVTEFKDLEKISEIILDKYPQLLTAKAIYKAPGDKFNTIPLVWEIPYLKTPSLRFDSRIVELTDTDISFEEFKECCLDIINNDKSVSMFSIEWEPGDIVIFDNNRCMHRRSLIAGNIQHKRITCDWHNCFILN